MRAWPAALMLVASGCSDDAPIDNGVGPGSGGASASSVAVTVASSTSSGLVDLPPEFTVEGVAVDEDGAPVAEAIVLQGGRSDEPTATSAADGSFSLAMRYDGMGVPAVVATKLGYRTGGVEIYTLPADTVEVTLYSVNPPDNPAYVYGEPGDGNGPSTAYCGHCHNTFADQFSASKHKQATKNPLVQDTYAGVTQAHATQASCVAAGGVWQTGLVPGTAGDTTSKCYLGGGVLPDLNTTCGDASQPACDDPSAPPAAKPAAFGACADCHAPGIDGVAGGRNLHEATGIAFDNGVHCDPCHKVAHIDPTQPAGVGGKLVLQRPSELSGANPRQVMFGPLLDVPNSFMGGSYQPQFAEAIFCSGCHEQLQPALIPGESLNTTRWPDGLPIHSTYSEWLAGPYAAEGVPCQSCHMPLEYGIYSTADLATEETSSITFGFPRPPEQIHAHLFRGPLMGNPRLIDTAIGTHIALVRNSTTLEATVTLGNIACGHALPTGEPLRALLLMVEAKCDGTPLVPIAGMTLPEPGGAHARGIAGTNVMGGGTAIDWSAAAAIAQPGMVVRAVRPTGVYDDYPGIGFFADPLLTPAEKGMEIHAPAGSATITSIAGTTLNLDAALSLLPGDVVYLGDPLAALDGQSAPALAGSAGYSFSKVLLDESGARDVHHYRAVDIQSDNRIPPGDTVSTQHSFALAGACSTATLDVRVLYRPVPLAMAELRGWLAKDYLVATASASAQ